MTTTIAFDVYGTLIDTQGISTALATHIGDKGAVFARIWREKQLEYSFRRGLMQHYADFAVCTRQALEFTNTFFGSLLEPQIREELMAAYRVLPAFTDAAAGLASASQAGFRLFAFSNGRADAVETLLNHANLMGYFEAVVSVDEVKSFKPNPGVYCHFLRRARTAGDEAWLVSSNPFDVIGAISAGMQAAWIKRSADALFDPWEIEPTLTINSLTELAGKLANQSG